MTHHPTISIPRDLPDVRVLRSAVLSTQVLLSEVESTLTTTTCRRCGRTISDFHGYDQPIHLRHLPILGAAVSRRRRPTRFRCPSCDDHPTTTQRLPWYTPKAVHTIAYEQHLLMQFVNRTIEDVCQKEATRPDALLGTIERWIAAEIEWTRVPPFSMVGIDESARKQGHRDCVVLVRARVPSERLVVLAVLPTRTKATLLSWRTARPPQIRHQIRTVWTDLGEASISAVREALPHACMVIDRFPVAKHSRACADTLRKQELKRLRKERSKEAAEQRKDTLWPVRQRWEELEPSEQERRTHFFEHSPSLQQAYELRETLTTLFDTASSKAEGLEHITEWRQRVAASGLSCFEPFLKLLETWLELIANYFQECQTSSFVAGLNNKLKLLKRRCYGLYHLRHLFQRIRRDLEGYGRFRRCHPAHPSIWA
jgi:transposase